MRGDEFDRVRKLKRIVGLSAGGRGIAGSVISVFSPSRDSSEREAARMLLLGMPLERALQPLLSSSKSAAWAFLRYLITESRVNSIEASRRAERLLTHLERWAQLRHARRMQQHVMEMRAHVISAIMGAVVSLFSSLAPIISSFQVSLNVPVSAPNSLSYLGLGFSLLSTIYLGLYLSPKRAYLDPIISSVSYFMVMILASPITSIATSFVGG